MQASQEGEFTFLHILQILQPSDRLVSLGI